MMHRDKASNAVFWGQEFKDSRAIDVCAFMREPYISAKSRHVVWASRGMTAEQLDAFCREFGSKD